MSLKVDDFEESLNEKHFYDIITKECEKTIEDSNNCGKRTLKKRKYKLGIFNIIITPCRLGRNLNCARESCEDENSNNCPVCFFATRGKRSVCNKINEMEVIPLISPFIFMPNAFPYLENQFLITITEHGEQYEIMNKNYEKLFEIFYHLLRINRDAVIFFNGMCGNSLSHFHCQITTTKFPIFEIEEIKKENFEGIIKKEDLIGYFKKLSRINEIAKIFELLEKNKIVYNFIVRYKNGLEIIFYIRHCVIEKEKDLNFGATELSGVIASVNEITYTLEDIKYYLEVTNNLRNYEMFEETLKRI